MAHRVGICKKKKLSTKTNYLSNISNKSLEKDNLDSFVHRALYLRFLEPVYRIINMWAEDKGMKLSSQFYIILSLLLFFILVQLNIKHVNNITIILLALFLLLEFISLNTRILRRFSHRGKIELFFDNFENHSTSDIRDLLRSRILDHKKRDLERLVELCKKHNRLSSNLWEWIVKSEQKITPGFIKYLAKSSSILTGVHTKPFIIFMRKCENDLDKTTISKLKNVLKKTDSTKKLAALYLTQSFHFKDKTLSTFN